jgi:hypothetical protein
LTDFLLSLDFNFFLSKIQGGHMHGLPHLPFAGASGHEDGHGVTDKITTDVT